MKPDQKSGKQRTNTQLTVKTGTEESLHWRADSVLVTFCHIGSIFVSLVKYIYISAILYAIYMLSKLIRDNMYGENSSHNLIICSWLSWQLLIIICCHTYISHPFCCCWSPWSNWFFIQWKVRDWEFLQPQWLQEFERI